MIKILILLRCKKCKTRQHNTFNCYQILFIFFRFQSKWNPNDFFRFFTFLDNIKSPIKYLLLVFINYDDIKFLFCQKNIIIIAEIASIAIIFLISFDLRWLHLLVVYFFLRARSAATSLGILINFPNLSFLVHCLNFYILNIEYIDQFLMGFIINVKILQCFFSLFDKWDFYYSFLGK